MNLLWAGTKVSRVGRAVSAWVNMLATLWDARGCVASANVREGERSQHRRSVTMYGGGWKGGRAGGTGTSLVVRTPPMLWYNSGPVCSDRARSYRVLEGATARCTWCNLARQGSTLSEDSGLESRQLTRALRGRGRDGGWGGSGNGRMGREGGSATVSRKGPPASMGGAGRRIRATCFGYRPVWFGGFCHVMAPHRWIPSVSSGGREGGQMSRRDRGGGVLKKWHCWDGALTGRCCGQLSTST